MVDFALGDVTDDGFSDTAVALDAMAETESLAVVTVTSQPDISSEWEDDLLDDEELVQTGLDSKVSVDLLVFDERIKGVWFKWFDDVDLGVDSRDDVFCLDMLRLSIPLLILLTWSNDEFDEFLTDCSESFFEWSCCFPVGFWRN